ncbi:MAG: NUDIX domain-containing protein [Candidatus Pacebacteria bacterium]|nr:NUDIX domain-containing protein [Candidatus Paceibacterota bacterium]
MFIKKERFKLIAEVCLVLIKEDKILLSRRYNTGYGDGYYSFPAGHLEEGETLKEGVVREAKEEVGIDVNISDLELIHVMDRNVINNERIAFFFKAKEWKGNLINMEPEKCDDLKWFKINELPENTIPYIRSAINFYLNNTIYSELDN